MLLLKLLDLFILLLLELLEFLPRPVDDFLNLGIYHHLFHLQAHLRLEAETAELALGLPNGLFVVFYLRLRFLVSGNCLTILV